jgi:hypothetical protein
LFLLDHEDAILFTREPASNEDEFLNRFSVMSPGRTAVKDRTIVIHTGADSGAGIWSCSKDHGNGCPHIKKARHQLQRLIHANPNAMDDNVELEVLDNNAGTALHALPMLYQP